MICGQCAAHSLSTASFCTNCGTAFDGYCRSCGGSNPPGAARCDHCACVLDTTPADARASQRAQRRQVTVMVCDLADVSSQPLDTFDRHQALRGFHDACGSAASLHDGYVAQYEGPSVLVYFGYPLPHEDHAERAVQAALETVERVRAQGQATAYPLSVRIGVHTGPVLVEDVMARARGDKVVLDDTPRVASGVQAAAEPDTVWISAATARALAGSFIVEEKRARLPRAISREAQVEPGALYQALGPARSGSRAAAHTPFVGRKDELQELLERWRKAREGRGQVVLIGGEAGIGKSRLVQVLRERLGEQPCLWYECAGSPYHRNTPFHPVVELLQQMLGWSCDQPVSERLTRLEQGLALAGVPLSDSVPLIAPLLSLPIADRYPPPFLSPEAQQRRTLESLAAWLCREAALQPMVLVLEDLQWADASTLALQELLVERCAGVPLLLVYTTRTEFHPAWLRRANLAELRLGRLSRGQAREIVEQVSSRVTLAAELIDNVIARTDGVPLFVEELTKAVLESHGGAGARIIPATLEDSLRARLDRLGPAREVAQLGAAVGRVFDYSLVRAVLDSGRPELGWLRTHAGAIAPSGDSFAPPVSNLDVALARLVEAELVFADGRPPSARYTFKHALVQDAAYASLSDVQRCSLHRSIAAVLTESFAQAARDEPELLAHHHTAAGDVQPAVSAWLRAGEKAAWRSAHDAALRHYRQALALLATEPESPQRHAREIALQFAVGTSLVEMAGFGHPDIEDVMERTRVLCEAVGDPWQLGLAVGGLANCCINRGELERGTALAEQSLQIARATGAEPLLVNGHLLLGMAEYYRGRFASSFENRQRAIAIHLAAPATSRDAFPQRRVETGRVDTRVAFGPVAWNFWMLGHPDRALAAAREAVEHARGIGHPFSLAFALFCETIVHFLRRDTVAQRATGEQLAELSKAQGFPLFQGLGQAYRAAALVAEGSSEGTPRQVYDGLMTALETATLGSAPQMIALVAQAQHDVGHHDQAIGKLDVALGVAEQTGQHFWDAEILRLKGESILGSAAVPDGADAPEAAARAEQCFREAIEVARSQEARSWELRAALSLARLWKLQGQCAPACELLSRPLRSFTEGLATPDLREAAALRLELEQR